MPIVRPRSSAREPARWRCRLFGCDWEVRKAYDLCQHCQAARWHVVRAAAAGGVTAAVPVPSAARTTSAWRAWSRPSLVLFDCEGSELFVDDDELAHAC